MRPISHTFSTCMTKPGFQCLATAHLLTVMLPLPPSVASSPPPTLSPLTEPPEPELELIIASCCRRRFAEEDIMDDGASDLIHGSSGIVDAVESCSKLAHFEVIALIGGD